MSAPISPSTAGALSMPIKVFDAAQCRPGDTLLARIIGTPSSGHTWLQVGGVKGVAQQMVAGRPGDMVLLQVAPRHQSSFGSSSRMAGSANPDSGEPKALVEIVFRQNGGLVRLSVVIKSARPQSASGERPLPTLQTLTPAAHLQMAPTVQMASALPMVRAVSSWIAGWRHKLAHLKALKANQTRFAQGDVSPARPPFVTSFADQTPSVSAPGEQHANVPGGAGWAGFHLDGGLVRLRFRRRSANPSRAQAGPELEAAFLLVLDNLGTVRTDLRMGADTLSVAFFVENRDCRRHFAEALPGLEAALAPLTAHYRCRVAVSPDRIDALVAEAGACPGETPLDVRI